MEYIDTSFATPEENLAFDETILDWVEENGGNGVLRFWEPPRFFVVIGYGNAISREVNQPFCQEGGIPILRRCSGGGTILQGPGCLNYGLILPISPEFESICRANKTIMQRNAGAIQKLIGQKIEVEGHTDLAINGRKFAGNSQRRKRNYLLFHGCLLLKADLEVLEAALLMPSREPEYRRGRTHSDFLMNLDHPPSALKESLRVEWGATENFSGPTEVLPEMALKYSSAEWNRRFE